jgi:hypothetical protein
MLANVQQVTIKPIIEAGVAKGSQIYTDEAHPGFRGGEMAWKP